MPSGHTKFAFACLLRVFVLALVLSGCGGASDEGKAVTMGTVVVTVTDLDGQPFPGVRLGCRRPASQEVRAVRTDRDGVGRLSSLELGFWDVSVIGNARAGGAAEKTRLNLSEENPDARLSLVEDVARALALSIVRGPTGLSAEAERSEVSVIHVLRGFEEVAFCGNDLLGLDIHVLGISGSGPFDVLVRKVHGLECALAQAVTLGGTRNRILTSAGKRVSGKVQPPDGIAYCRATYRGVVIGLATAPDGSFESCGLPDGIEVEVEALARQGDRAFHGRSRARPGDKDVLIEMQLQSNR